MTLSEEAEFSERVVPACLPASTNRDYAGDLLTASGWGLLSFPGEGSDTLQAVQVPYITNDICRGNETDYGPNSAWRDTDITANMICAGNVTHGSIDSCSQDSGGNLMIYLIFNRPPYLIVCVCVT